MATRTLESDRNRKRELRREELLDAADRIVRDGGCDTSMEEIATEAGITKPILYRHFGDKDGFYEALAERYVEELKAALLPAAAARAGDRLAASIDGPRLRRARARAIPLPARGRRTLAHRRGSCGTSGASASGASADHSDRRTFAARGSRPPSERLWAHAVSGLVREVGIWWLETRALSREQVFEHLTAVLWEGGAALPKYRKTS